MGKQVLTVQDMTDDLVNYLMRNEVKIFGPVSAEKNGKALVQFLVKRGHTQYACVPPDPLDILMADINAAAVSPYAKDDETGETEPANYGC